MIIDNKQQLPYFTKFLWEKVVKKWDWDDQEQI